MKKQEKNGMSAGAIAAISAGVIALAAGSYYFFGPEGKKNRGKLKGWMIKMKGDIVEKMEHAKDLSETAYEKIVDSVAAKYGKGGKVAEAELRTFAQTLKGQWKGFAKKAGMKVAKAPAKKPTAKKVAPKKVAAKKAPAKKRA